MKIQRFIPFLVVAVIAGALAYGQGWLQPKQSPKTGEEIRSQVATPGNRLEDLRRLDLEIELVNDREVKLTYAASGDQDQGGHSARDRQMKAKLLAKLWTDQAIAGAIPLPADEPLTLIQAVLDQLAIAQTDVREFEFEYVLTDDSRGVVELQVKDHNDDDWDDDGGRDDS